MGMLIHFQRGLQVLSAYFMLNVMLAYCVKGVHFDAFKCRNCCYYKKRRNVADFDQVP